jgi:hypothetical protein
MNTERELIFRKALQSNNLEAVLSIARAFDELGEKEKAQVLVHRVRSYSIEYPVGFGVDYAAVQKKLNDLGTNPALDVDGKWGPKSKAALITYQKGKGLTADGIPGPITLSALGISGANETASSTMGHVMPSNDSADAKAYAVGQKAGKEMGLTEQEIQYVVSVARGEGGYGGGWGHPSAKTIELSKQFGLTGYEGANSNNWGACQGSGSAGSFPHVDLGWMVPDANGKPTSKHWPGNGAKVWGPYIANYRKYATPEDGFKDMARIILGGGKRKAAGATEIKQAIAQGNLQKAVYAQHANGYFELAPDQYLSAVMSNYTKIMNGVGWPKLLTIDGVTQALAQAGVTPAKAGMGIGTLLALSALGIFLFRKPLGLVTA